jgi:hypothetical protein
MSLHSLLSYWVLIGAMIIGLPALWVALTALAFRFGDAQPRVKYRR